MTTALLRAATLSLICLTLPASAETIGARYEIYAGGFHALGIKARAVLTDESYDVAVDLKSTGVLDWLLRFSQKVEGRGQIGATTAPLYYLSDGTFFGSQRTTRLDYRTDGRIEATLKPATEDGERTPLTDDMKLGTIDPMSAFVAVNRSAKETGNPCNAKIPVYDGRRRFNVVLEDDGVSAVEEAASPCSPARRSAASSRWSASAASRSTPASMPRRRAFPSSFSLVSARAEPGCRSGWKATRPSATSSVTWSRSTRRQGLLAAACVLPHNGNTSLGVGPCGAECRGVSES